MTCSSGDNNAVSVLVKFVVGFTDAVSGGKFGIGTFGNGVCGLGKLPCWSLILSCKSSTAGCITFSCLPSCVVLKNSCLSDSDKPLY